MYGLGRRSALTDSVIAAFGYGRREGEPGSPSEEDEGAVGDLGIEGVGRGRRSSSVAAVPEPGIWVCDACEPLEGTPPVPVPIDDPPPLVWRQARPPPVPTLHSAAQMLSLWDEALRQDRRSREVDLPAAVRVLAEARPVIALPRLARTAFTSDVVLVLDRRDRLRPMWNDQGSLFVHLHSLLDDTQCRLLALHHDPDELCGFAKTGSSGTETLPEHCHVLVVSDFDVLDPRRGPELQAAWTRWLRQLLRRDNAVVTLGVGGRAPEVECPHVELADGDVSREAVNVLVAAMARAHLPKVDRLRHLRLALNDVRPCSLAEELAVWNHPDRRTNHAGQWSLRPERIRTWLDHYAALPGAERNALDRALHDWRAALPPSQAGLEALIGSSVNLERPPDGGFFLPALQAAKGGEAGAERLRCWLRAANPAFCTAAPSQRVNPSLQPLFEAAQAAAYEAGLPQPLGLQALDAVVAGPMRFVQIGRRLVATERNEPGLTVRHGAWPWLDVATERAIAPEQTLEGAEHTLRSSSETVVLKRLTMPRWAERFGRLDDGVQAAHRDGARFLLRQADAATPKAYWQLIDERWSWASDTGVDGYGLWAAFDVEGVEQRLRWIPAGEFDMGSPASERDRLDSETLHHVRLREGYWLAETACTQALWEAVTGESPSHFKGAERPVEQVSWEEVQGFCRRLNERLPGLEARLPTEAEWEYAARAGTRTAFWWGDELTVARANYNGNHPYADGEQGEYREETVEVKAFEANPWGLYQVHGNVWEWCADWYGAYPEKMQENPRGPDTGEGRVVRGGSWFDYGQHLRAAYRLHFGPGDRRGLLGFRLAAGQGDAEHRGSPT